MTRKYTAFTPAFKLQTLELANKPNTCIAQFARDLGIRRNASFSGYHKERFLLRKKNDAYGSHWKLLLYIFR